jgi:4-alpha-glucanotransferase
MADSDLERLADLCGIESHYLNEAGEYCRPSLATHRALLKAMGYDISTDDAVAKELHDLECEPWLSPLPPVLVVRTPSPTVPSVPLSLPAGPSVVAWDWQDEAGRSARGEIVVDDLPLIDAREIDGRRRERRALPLPLLPEPGYHRLRLSFGDEHHERIVIAVPESCFLPPYLQSGPGDWGLTVQLYGLRSARNWGIGDFHDLHGLIRGAGALGAAAVGLNPLHALTLSNPRRASPYSPTSRLMLNPLYIDVESALGFSGCAPLQDMIRAPAFTSALAGVRSADLVDYAGVARLKLEALRVLHRCNSGDEAFQRYRVEAGRDLRVWALFEALKDHFGGLAPWWEWPMPYQDPGSAAVAEFAHEKAETVDFFEFLQWQAEMQLRAVAAEGRQAGLRIGLYHDLALGVGRDSAEAWASPALFVDGVSVGSPPDDYNPKGQDWGIAPMDARVLRSRAYEPFAAMLRAGMKQAGAIRMDHVMQLQRLFWIPPGETATEGTYVRQPFEDMIGVLALESQRQRCVVVGEDLGTVPAGFRARMERAGVLSYRLLYFQQDSERGFQPPESYPQLSLVAVGTHDLPTLAAYWSGADIELRRGLGLYASDDDADQAQRRRASERRNLLVALIEDGALDPPAPDPEAPLTPNLVRAIHEFIARSPGRLVMLRIEDLLDVEAQTNVPGTDEEHPNWQSRLPVDLQALFDDPRVHALASLLRRYRPPPGAEAAE